MFTIAYIYYVLPAENIPMVGSVMGDGVGETRLRPMKPRESMSVAYCRKAARLPKKEMLFVSNR
jgi:hypothetical protein